MCLRARLAVSNTSPTHLRSMQPNIAGVSVQEDVDLMVVFAKTPNRGAYGDRTYHMFGDRIRQVESVNHVLT
jgi:hypothetical protein